MSAAYSGTMMAELMQLVDRARMQFNDSTICAICGKQLGAHSHDGWNCPNPSDFGPLYATSTFVAIARKP